MTAPTVRPGSRDDLGEDGYRIRRVHGAEVFTSRQRHGDLTIVASRFALRDESVPSASVDPTSPAPVFVLVHGVGVSSRYFGPLAAELARRGAVHVVDLPGFGAAPHPRRRPGIEDHAAVLAAFLERSGLIGAILVGHSWGAQVVSLALRDHPELTDRAVLMSPTLPPAIRTFWRAFGRLMLDALREPPVVFGIAFVDYVLRCGPPYLLRHVPAMLADRMEDRMALLRARILLITGDRDPLVSPAWARELAGLGRRTEYREVHGPHVIMHTEPEMIARHILAFADAPRDRGETA